MRRLVQDNGILVDCLVDAHCELLIAEHKAVDIDESRDHLVVPHRTTCDLKCLRRAFGRFGFGDSGGSLN